MATLYREIAIDKPAAQVWDAVREFGAVHRRLVPGFVTECRVDGDDRIVTFFNGSAVRERLLGIDEAAKRLAYTVVDGQFTHHNASVQVIATAEGRCRFVWITDLLPAELAGTVGQLMDQGAAVIKKTLSA